VSSGYNQGGFAPPPQGGYPGQAPGFGPQGAPPRPPAGGAKPVPPVVIWIILAVTALNLILTSVSFFRGLAAESAARDALEQYQDSLGGLDPGNFPSLGG
jgi:hypothetical protein